MIFMSMIAFKKFFGIGFGYMDFNNSTEFTTRFQGQSFSDSNKGENTITMIRPGFAFELFKVHFAFYAEKLNNEEMQFSHNVLCVG